LVELKTKVIEVIPRTHNVKSVRVEAGDREDFKPGQWLFVELSAAAKLTRHLTISNSPTETGYIEFTKKITDSEFSKNMDVLGPGEPVKIKYPFGNFTFMGEYEKIAFLIGGIGITPVRGIIKYIIDKKLPTDTALIYANRTEKDIAFKDELDGWQDIKENLKVVHVLSEAGPGWKGRSGHINGQMIKEELPDFRERKFYICGPPAMVQAMRAVLTEELILTKEDIITENFTGY